MSLREIDTAIGILDLAAFQTASEWKKLECELVTPLHGGGVEARKSDVNMPVRVTEIRGGLRFWWRILSKYKFEQTKNLSDKELRQAEFALWGGMNDGEESGKASLVFLRVKLLNKLDLAFPKNALEKQHQRDEKLAYALFTTREDKKNKQPEMMIGKSGLKWILEYSFDPKITLNQKEQVLETLRWWTTLGGIGGRTRRGCGALFTKDLNLVSEQEMRDLGCEILFSGSLKSAEQIQSAWSDAIGKWKEIRKSKKTEFEQFKDDNSRHLATVFSRPVYDVASKKWCGMVIVLPNSSADVKKVLGVSS